MYERSTLPAAWLINKCLDRVSNLSILLGASSCFLKAVCVTFASGEVIAVVGSCETLGKWCHQEAVTLQPTEEDGYVSHAIFYLFLFDLDALDYMLLFCLFCLVSTLWRTTVLVPRGAETKYRYFKGLFFESKVRWFS